MLIAAAVVPHPPVLVPAIARGLAPDLDELRTACDTAISRIYAAGADELLIVGVGPEENVDVTPRGGFHEYGVDLRVDGLWEALTDRAMPMTLPFLIAAWLLRDRPADPVRRPVMVSEKANLDGSAAVSVSVSGVGSGGKRQAMLVLGDGSASRTPQAPGHYDERAEAYDATVARALATADAGTLAGLDPELSRRLHVAGLPAWRTLAAAAQESGVEYQAKLLYDQAPYGVGYFVATWLAR